MGHLSRWIVLAALYTLAGCAGFRYHGEYCGPRYPKPNTFPAAADDLDVPCQSHDSCYSAGVQSRYACDLQLVKELLSLSLNPPCQNTAREMALYFAGLHPSTVPGNPLADALILAGKASEWPLTAAGIFERSALLVAEGRATKTTICCDRRFMPEDGSPCYPRNATSLHLAIMAELLRWHKIEGLSYETAMPNVAIDRARSLALVPKNQTIFAIARDAGSALAFTEAGMFFGGIIGGHGFLSYDELGRTPIRIVDRDTISLGLRKFRITDWPEGALYDIVTTVRDTALRARISATQLLPPGFSGRWIGAVRQSGARPYSVTVVIEETYQTAREGVVVGKIEYPEVQCGGSLILLSSSERTLRVDEILTAGARRCVSGGEVTLHLTNNGFVEWSWDDGDRRHAATAVLSKE